MSRATYEIRIAGEVPLDMLDNFESIHSVTKATSTTLHADLADSAALHGLLIVLRRAGLELLDVRREQPPEPPDRPSATLGDLSAS